MRTLMLAALVLPLCAPSFAPQDGATEGKQDPAPAPLFRNVAKELGLDGKPAGRAVLADLDGDGLLDCVLQRQRVYLQQKSGAWKDASDASKLNADRAGDVVIFGDFDNDGDLDCFSGKNCNLEQTDKEGKLTVKDDGFRSRVLLNDGHAVFTPVAKSGVEENPATIVSALCFDFDADGKLDLFISNAYRNYDNSYEAYPSRLMRGRGDGTFEDATEKMGLLGVAEPGRRDSRRPLYGATHADWNNDGRQDILTCTYGRQWNCLWKNSGERFVDVGDETHFDGDDDRSGVYPADAPPRLTEKPFRANGNTFDCAIGDIDNDGDLDCFLGEITHWWAGPSSDLSSILWNGGAAKAFAFRRDATSIARRHEGKPWNQGDLHAAWLDYDNDGLLDLLIGSSDYPDRQELKLYRQNADHSFTEMTKEAGFDWEGSGQLSIADVDRDGDLDILVGKSFFRLPAERTKDRIPEAALFRNETGNKNSWIELRLSGTTANRQAIGARVTATSGGVSRMREIRGGEGHSGHQDPAELHFGLGAAGKIDELVVRWPDRDGTTQRFKDVKARTRYVLVQGGALEEAR